MNKTQSIISALVVLVVEVAGMFNLTLDNGTVEIIITGIAMVVVLLWGVWKNHNLTDAANLGETLIRALKKTDEDGVEAAKQAATEYIAKHISNAE